MKHVNELIQKLSSAIDKYDALPVNEKPRPRFSGRLFRSAIVEAAVWTLAREIVKSARDGKKDAYSGTEPMVVGHLNPPDSGFYRLTVDTYHPDAEPLMTVKQHKEITDDLRKCLGDAQEMLLAWQSPTLMGEPVIANNVPVKRDLIHKLFRAAGCSSGATFDDVVQAAIDKLTAKPEKKEIDWKEEHAAFRRHFRISDLMIFDPHASKHYVKSDGENYTPAQFIDLCQVAVRMDQLWKGWEAATIRHHRGE